jgi:cyclopropane fatty-acyl-phospholipid synthase-like methyltransferase
MEAGGYLVRVFRATEEENRRAILRTLAPRPGARLLDLGTSEASFTLRVAERLRAARVAGVELIEEHAAAARNRGIEVHRGDLEDGLRLRPSRSTSCMPIR